MATKTSIQAYKDIFCELGNRQKQVYDLLKINIPMNNLMISKALNKPINSITPRIYELRKKNLVFHAFTKNCKFTSKQTKYWSVSENSLLLNRASSDAIK